MSGIKDKLAQNESETKEMLDLRNQARMRVPNILENDVPIGEDEEGNEIWNSGNENIIFYNTDYYGQLFGAKAILSGEVENYLPVIEYDLNNIILWKRKLRKITF